MLEEENNGTRVTIVESGFELLSAETRQKREDQTGMGYSEFLKNLKSLL
jgi:hypothetical protein